MLSFNLICVTLIGCFIFYVKGNGNHELMSTVFYEIVIPESILIIFGIVFLPLFINFLTDFKKRRRFSIDLSNRIIGGSSLKITDAPYMAMYITYMSNSPPEACGACIVHERFLLTAAHCYSPNYKHHVKVSTDSYDGGIKHDIEKLIVHPQYDTEKLDYDIAVIKLKNKLVLNDRVNVIKLATKNSFIKPGAIMETMGFGRTEDSLISHNLLIVKVPYVTTRKCMSELNITITTRMICAGGVKNQDACSGDSGGPLVYRNLLYGLVSFGHGCGLKIPAVYASIPALRDFVDKTIETN